ncbi:MAG TPA: threonine/serine dehydratase [Vicinamibacteria bacterium]|nr:threonine/serine dehydratase [Vicinamibacteria bacterium]
MELSFQLIQQVRPRVERKARRTPLDPSPALSEISGREVFLKCENLQRTGSFKIRGATAKMSSLSEEERRRGVVAASAGNHGQCVAWLAREMGIEATLYVPSVIPSIKRAAMERHGAKVVVSTSEGYDAVEAEAMAACAREGRTWISPYDDPEVMAGAGTVGCEVFEEIQDLDALLIPVGGGGLAVGVGVAARALSPSTRILGVNTSASPALYLSRQDGKPRLTLESKPTLAEGLEGGISQRAFELANEYVDDVLAAEESSLPRAIAEVLKAHRFAIEGSAAVVVAALLDGQVPSKYRRLGLILSGGNIDYARLRRIVQEQSLEN